jgi:HSP20 family protein
MDKPHQSAFRGLFDRFAEVNRIREQALHPMETSEGKRHGISWIPVTDIFARGEDIVIRSELAGVRPEDVDVSFSNGTLTIWGERGWEPDPGETTFYVRERRYGTCRRTIDLPDGVERSDISATFQDGLLEVTITGGATARDPDRIEVKTAGDGPVKVM